MDARLPIGLFDSGVGGLTVLKAVHELLPGESLIYLGDTARVPYGTKSQATITKYTTMAAGKLLEYGVKMIVIACNTATAAALPHLARKFAPAPVLGVVEPGAAAAVAATNNNRIGVIATEATIKGGAYQKAISVLLPQACVTTRACTMLVPLAEEGWLEGEITEAVIQRYLADVFKPGQTQPDTLLLGCTHFPLFRSTLQKIAGKGVNVVDSALATARAVAKSLAANSLLNDSQSGSLRLLTTDNVERFAQIGGRFLGRELGRSDIELVDL